MRLHSAAGTLSQRLPSSLRWEPWSVLVPLVVAEWIGIAAYVGRVKHNGWLFYHGGDQTWYFTTGWIFGDGHIPETFVGYGWSLVLAPLTWIVGPSYLDALPIAIVLQLLLFVPLGAWASYALGARAGGRLVGYLSAAVWTLAPFATIPFFTDRYHDRWLDQFLPEVFGLTALGDLPATLALLLAGVLVLRSLDERQWIVAAAAGVAAGFAIGIKPSNLLFLPAPAVAYVVARRPREAVGFAAALAPCLLTLALWKLRGLGHLPVLQQAAGAYVASGSVPLAALPKSAHFDWDQLQKNFHGLQEFSWNARLLQWLPIAGFVGLLRRAPVKALFFGTWLATYLLVKGGSSVANVEAGSFWRLLMPAFPAYCALMASIPLLWPRTGVRLPERFPYAPRRWLPVAVPAVIFLVVPLAAVSASTPLRHERSAAEIGLENLFVPIDRNIHLRVTNDRGAVTLRWSPVRGENAKVFYAVYRSPTRWLIGKGSEHLPVIRGIFCEHNPHGAVHCTLEMARVATTRGTEYREGAGNGNWTYRVAVVANWLNDPTIGDPFYFSGPVSVHVP
jgi:hypothetical protein